MGAAVPTQSRSGTETPREAASAARLALAELLLFSEEPVECARATVDWLAERIGARKAVCALIDAESGTVQHVAASGVPEGQIETLHLAMENPEHPLVFALAGREAVMIGKEGRRNGADPWRGDFVAIPLPLSEKREARQGLLLVSPARCEPEAKWAAELLGQKIARLRATAAILESEHRLQRERELLLNIINASPDPILLTEPEGRMIISNARADALFSTKEGESEGRHRAVALNNMLFSAALSQQAIESGAARRELLLVSPSEGSDLLFELLSSVVQHPREGTCVVSILRNVTDLRAATEQIEENYRRLKVAEADVRAERDRLDLIIDSVADPILVTDPSGKILLMNSPAERLFTAPESDETAEAERAVRSNDAHFSSFVSNLFLTGKGLRWRGEISLIDPSTLQALPVEAVAGKVLSEHGEVTAVVTILHDRTEALEKARLYEQVKAASEQLEEKVREATGELVRRNELLQRQHFELEQASQLKSQFLANMSHEFRTPLNAILGYTSMLLQGVSGDMSPPQKNKMLRVDSNARHLLSIINDILDISRIEAGKMPLHLEEVEMAALVGELLAEVEPLIQKARLQVLTDLQPGLQPAWSDRQKVKQIVLNLLTNAIKFTPLGHVKVIVRGDEERREVRIAVEDTGIGIAPQDHDRVFEDFRQADNSVTREYGGAGLGLAICRRLAKMLDGRIELVSNVGAGSTFTLVIPRRGKR
ncbi:MAG: PAS domain-containing sensor histidine kinase [Deltaproteobacteria bacterium]|nr:MAG: PAS domain-containing sensor histidine kinase [Deltaproteobacteria bacterium]